MSPHAHAPTRRLVRLAAFNATLLIAIVGMLLWVASRVRADQVRACERGNVVRVELYGFISDARDARLRDGDAVTVARYERRLRWLDAVPFTPSGAAVDCERAIRGLL